MDMSLTKVSALKLLLEDNWWIATWEIIYNEIEKYYPDVKSPKDWQAALRWVLYRDIWKNFKKIDEWVFSLLSYNEEKLLYEWEPKETSKQVLTNIRIWQNEFRKKLILSLKKCPITGINDTRILNASHIKPWVMSNNIERLDIYNGFLLSPTFDKLFDKWIITFDLEKRIIISQSIDEKNINFLWISNKQYIQDLPISWREEYLEYHRNKIFIHY